MSSPRPAFSRPRALAVIGLFAAATAGTGAVDLAAPLPTRESVHKPPTPPRLVDGSLLRGVEDELTRRSRVGAMARAPYAAFLFGRLGTTTIDVVRGKDRMLFLRRRLAYRSGPADDVAGGVAAIMAALERRFFERGTTLVPLLVPEKDLLYPERLPPAARSRDDLYDRVIADLTSRGVRAVDALKILDDAKAGGVRIETASDTHWTGAAAALCAEAAASAAGLSKPVAERASRLAWVAAVPDVGDLAHLTGLEVAGTVAPGFLRDLALPGLEPDPIPRPMRVGPDGAPSPRPPPVAPPAVPPLALAGTSFSLHQFLYDFAEMLTVCTDLPCVPYTFQDAGPIIPLRVLANQCRPLPRVAVWEIPSSYAFTGPKPLERAGELLADLPPFRYASVFGSDLAGRDAWSAAAAAHGARRLDAAHGRALTFDLPRGRIVHEGRGAVHVRVHGAVEGGEIYVVVDAGVPVDARWTPGHHEIFLPALGPGMVDGGRITLYGDDVDLTLKGVEVTVDAATKPEATARVSTPAAAAGGFSQKAEFSAATTPSPRAALALRLTRKPAVAGPLRVRMQGEDGRERVVSLAYVAADADVFLDPTPLGAALRRVVVEGEGAPPEALFESVMLRPLDR